MTGTLPRVEQAVMDEYALWMRSWNASARTIKARVNFVSARLRDWDGLAGLTTANVTRFMAALVEEERSEWTVSTYYTHLTSFCDWAHAAEYLPENPMDQTRVPTRPKSEPRPISDADLERVLAVAQGEVADWILLTLHAGLRSHEGAKIRGEDVQVDGIRVKGKGRLPATLPCHPGIWEMAQRYPRQGYWFPGTDHGHMRSAQVSGKVGTLFEALGIEGSLHRVRHAFATRLLRSGVHIRKVQKLMRHASLATTAAYTAVDEDELRDAILKLPAATT